MNRIPLADGPVPVLLLVLGALALLWLVWQPPRTRVRLPLAVLGSGILTLVLYLLAEHLLYWWDASLPRLLYIYAWAGICALLLAVPRFRGNRRTGPRLVTVAAALTAVLAVAGSANAAYAQYPTLGALVSPPQPREGNLPERDPADAAGRTPTTEKDWTPPPDMPRNGSVHSVPIPGTQSGYAAKPALVYVPPAYLASPAAVSLPVLVLIHGRPGSPQDWLTSGQLIDVLDGFAAAHSGLAPVVVMPDVSSGEGGNWPLCLDSPVGNAASYLSIDVPAWVRNHLAAGLAGPHQWAVGGYSYGGTCALQLAVYAPQTYPTFLDVSGEQEPTVARGRQALLDTYFDGDGSAFADQNPLDLLERGRYQDSAGLIVVGSQDSVFAPQGAAVCEAARAAGMDVQLQVLPGGHSWRVWKAGVATNLEWLARRMGILSL